jgi:hypothetical protein
VDRYRGRGRGRGRGIDGYRYTHFKYIIYSWVYCRMEPPAEATVSESTRLISKETPADATPASDPVLKIVAEVCPRSSPPFFCTTPSFCTSSSLPHSVHLLLFLPLPPIFCTAPPLILYNPPALVCRGSDIRFIKRTQASFQITFLYKTLRPLRHPIPLLFALLCFALHSVPCLSFPPLSFSLPPVSF